MKTHVGIQGNETADFLAKKGSSIGHGHSDELQIPKANQKKEISNYFKLKWTKTWNLYEQARQTKIWFPKPNSKKSSVLLRLERDNLSKLVQFLTGHNKLMRHKNIQEGISEPDSCRLCRQDEESSFHVIAECPAMQKIRTGVFKNPRTLPNPPEWTVSQVEKFLKVSPVGDMLEQNYRE